MFNILFMTTMRVRVSSPPPNYWGVYNIHGACPGGRRAKIDKTLHIYLLYTIYIYIYRYTHTFICTHAAHFRCTSNMDAEIWKFQRSTPFCFPCVLFSLYVYIHIYIYTRFFDLWAGRGRPHDTPGQSQQTYRCTSENHCHCRRDTRW